MSGKSLPPGDSSEPLREAPTSKIAERRIGHELSGIEKFLDWIKRYATLLSVAGVLAGITVTVGILLWATTSARFDDAAVRIGDTRADVRAAEARLTTQIGDVKSEVRDVEGRLGKRIDDLKTEIREARQERKADMNAVRLDIQGLRQDRPTNDAGSQQR